MKYLILIICLFISALCFNILQYPNNLVSGGIPGIAVILNTYLNIKPSTIILVISIILLILSYFLLGKDKAVSSMISTIIYPIFIKLTSYIGYSFVTDKIIISIVIGVITGISVGLIYKVGFNNGGISILIEIISKYTKIHIPVISFILNMIIILLGITMIDNKMVIYSSIIIIINSLIIKSLTNK